MLLNVTLSVKIINNSGREEMFCLYLTSSKTPFVSSLAWGSVNLRPDQKVDRYILPKPLIGYADYVPLLPGTLFNAITSEPAAGGTTNFCNNAFSSSSSKFYKENIPYPSICSCNDIKSDQYSIGLGNPDGFFLAYMAIPSTCVLIEPDPFLWITFGDSYMDGVVLDTSKTKAEKLIFTPGRLNLTATLNNNNEWEIEST
jgi:hypothetical protein